jgi:hypothetical protein
MDLMNVYEIDCGNPGMLESGHRLAKIKDGVVMLFGGNRNSFGEGWSEYTNETWIFELTTGIKDNYNDTARIYVLDDNIYLLGDEIKDAVLYNLLGQKIMECKEKRLDMNHLPIGLYILQYTENEKIKSVKLLKL